jgi:hypothetical protein
VANLYGVANPNPPPGGGATIGNAQITCPAGVETNWASVVPPLPTMPGVFYPAWTGYAAITIGATIPTLIVIACRLNGGADILTETIHGGFYVASASFIQPFFFYGSSQIFSNPSGVFNFQMSCNPTAQGVTVNANSTQLIAQWIRATDQ